MAALLAQQVAKGGVVGVGDSGPPPLTITTPADHDVCTFTFTLKNLRIRTEQI